jgi:hypothetical protein
MSFINKADFAKSKEQIWQRATPPCFLLCYPLLAIIFQLLLLLEVRQKNLRSILYIASLAALHTITMQISFK